MRRVRSDLLRDLVYSGNECYDDEEEEEEDVARHFIAASLTDQETASFLYI